MWGYFRPDQRVRLHCHLGSSLIFGRRNAVLLENTALNGPKSVAGTAGQDCHSASPDLDFSHDLMTPK